jgi:hypothetical protein
MAETLGALRFDEFLKRYGLGRTKAYELVNSGDLPIVKLGGRTLVRVEDAEALLKRHLKSAPITHNEEAAA